MNTLLVPTDFSKGSLVAVKYAIQFAQKTERKILFFHSTFILIPIRSSNTTYLHAVQSNKTNKLKELITFIDKAYQSLNIKRDETRTKFLVKHNHFAVDSILEAINEQFIDLIIMGTHGATGFRKVIFGSNTAKVLEQAYCPVLAIPAKYKYSPIKKISYAVSDIQLIKKELKIIIEIANKFDASIDIVHIVGGSKSDIKLDNIEPAKILTNLTHHFKYYKLNLYIVDGKDKPLVQELNRFVKHQKSELLVMLTNKRSFFDKVFNSSQTKELAYNLNIPLLAI